MTKPEIIAHNEALAIRKIQAAYTRQGLYEAMKLTQLFMGVDAVGAYKTVTVICNITN